MNKKTLLFIWFSITGALVAASVFFVWHDHIHSPVIYFATCMIVAGVVGTSLWDALINCGVLFKSMMILVSSILVVVLGYTFIGVGLGAIILAPMLIMGIFYPAGLVFVPLVIVSCFALNSFLKVHYGRQCEN